MTTTGDRDLPRASLVDVARLAAWNVLTGRKALTDDILKRATSAGFDAICRADRAAGTKTHACAAYAHGVSALAVEGVVMARAMWDTQRARAK
jgi:hypothetical protein